MQTHDDRLERIGQIAAALPSEYQPVDERWEPVVTDQASAIGTGGSSIVLPTLYRGRLRRAVKVFIPRQDLRRTLDMSHFVASYENELVSQARLSHQNISKITDFASLSVDGTDYPFIATEYIHGIDIRNFAQRPETSGREVFRLLKDVLRGLSYLHNNQVMHCDLKQDNILIELGTDPSAIIVDLGSSRNFPLTLNDEEENELIYLFTTTRYVPSRLRLVVANWTQNRISRAELRRFFPYQDLHAFGVILDDFLEDPTIGSKLRQAVGSGNAEAIYDVRRRLRDPRPGAPYFQSADEVSETLDRLSKYSLAVLGVPELTLAPERGVVIPGIAARIHSTGRVDRIMSHPLFQRFHNLPQLDLLYWTLPGATQSRYVHAAHAYELARQAIGYLLNDWEVRLNVAVKDIETLLFSSLLNQVGHYHFLHMFEDFMESRGSDTVVDAANLQDDDELLDDILLTQHSGAASALALIRDERGRTLPEIVDSLGLDWSDVRRRQRNPATPLEGVLASLLSGPLDIEKLAYLRDDSRTTGIQFGEGLDANPIFESVVVPNIDDWKREGGVAGVALGIKEQAMSYLEYGVLTRYWNIQAAYWNRTNRAVQTMLKYQLGCLLRAGLLDFGAYIADTLHMGADGALRWINARFEYAKDDGLIDDATVNPMSDLLESRRMIYRRLVTISGRSIIPGRDPDHMIYERARAQSPLSDENLTQLVGTALAEIRHGLIIRPGEVLLDLPRVSRDTSSARVLVYTDDDHKYMGELFKISPNLQQHQMSFEHYVKRMRVYVHPRIYETLRREGLLNRAYEASLSTLRGAFVR